MSGQVSKDRENLATEAVGSGWFRLGLDAHSPSETVEPLRGFSQRMEHNNLLLQMVNEKRYEAIETHDHQNRFHSFINIINLV